MLDQIVFLEIHRLGCTPTTIDQSATTSLSDVSDVYAVDCAWARKVPSQPKSIHGAGRESDLDYEKRVVLRVISSVWTANTRFAQSRI